jgi:hypothetical protein
MTRIAFFPFLSFLLLPCRLASQLIVDSASVSAVQITLLKTSERVKQKSA